MFNCGYKSTASVNAHIERQNGENKCDPSDSDCDMIVGVCRAGLSVFPKRMIFSCKTVSRVFTQNGDEGGERRMVRLFGAD